MRYLFVQGENRGYKVALLFNEKGRFLANGVPSTSLSEAEITLMKVISKHVRSYRACFHPLNSELEVKVSNLVELLILIFLGEIEPTSTLILREFPIEDHPWLNAREVQVIKYLLRVPLGKVTSYKQVSKAVGLTPRAIARIMAKNPYPVVYPCHRVIHTDGYIGGYLGSREFMNLKRALLVREGVIVKRYKVDKGFFISF